MSDAADDHVTVYRGFEPNTVDMLESMLQTEGLQPRRQGRANPARAGVGMYALEQRIEVPAEHADSARALIAAFQQGASSEQAADLEEQAMHADPALQGRDAPRVSDPRPLIYVVLVLAIAVGLMWLAK